MSAVDVLAALEFAAEILAEDGWHETADEVAQARAAVAELIAADEEYDAAKASFWGGEYNAELLRLDAAIERRRAALAACKGETEYQREVERAEYLEDR